MRSPGGNAVGRRIAQNEHMQSLLMSLPVPIAVAVVTALVTSLLSARRARNDRLAALRLETYRDLVRRAQKWTTSFVKANEAELRGEDPTDVFFEWERSMDQLREQMNTLPIIARKGAVERIEHDFDTMVRTVMQINTDAEDWEGEAESVRRAQRSMNTFIARVITEARREIRRTGV